MRPLFQPLILSCKKASELTDKAGIYKLKALERVKLKMHLKICAYCNAYSKHGLLIDQALNKLVNPEHPAHIQLPEHVRAKILNRIV